MIGVLLVDVMKLAQNKIRWLARLMLGLFLFVQGVVAASACVIPSAGPAQAFASAPDDGTAPCHEEEISNANVCLAHCTQGDQIGADQHMQQLAVPVSVIGWASSQPQIRKAILIADAGQVVFDTGPPIPIRFCSLLN